MTFMTHIIAFEAGQSGQGTFEHVTLGLSPAQVGLGWIYICQ